MYRTLADARHRLAEEATHTLAILDALTDAALAQGVTPEDRTLGRLAWHLVACRMSIATQAGLAVEGPALSAQGDLVDPVPATIAEIRQAFIAAQAALDRALEAWTDADLAQETPMYGEVWTKGFCLEAIVAHEAHHRGQMTVLMRQAGLVPPGIYGPTREGWAGMGMAAPQV